MRKKITCIIASILVSCLSLVSAINQVYIPNGNSADPDYAPEASYVRPEHSYLSVISFVNEYLWWAVGLVCFIFIIWHGIQLIIVRGDTAQMKKTIKALTGFGVGIVICLLAYIIVKLVVGLFA